MLNPLKIMTDFFNSQAHYYRIMKELSNLTDRELADIGLNRYEISFVAMDTARKDLERNLVTG